MNTNIRSALLLSATLLSAAGCLSVKTENEIKPIHITMDVNLKVDKELDKVYADENDKRKQGHMKEVKDLMDRKVAGLTSKALLEARAGATDDDKIAIAEANERRLKRFNEIASSSGVSLEAVQKRYAKKMLEKIPEKSGVWYQDDTGAWKQK